ncbi:G/U mismatch-specific uracil-DNA glycosylase [Psychrobacter fozii]|uniref:G/U mismatch-specific uracil-DNA glycosylase n=2 Tax=Psychrobacter fozii TaxID=198480 RepID=A0A2V4UHQ1_9GAMM|nr:DNA glycosylase [Psychrobacter fozii]PYE38379.1 G/U mismatch-specific uracil-DNA glycosylase [Psychrobacter fozii]
MTTYSSHAHKNTNKTDSNSTLSETQVAEIEPHPFPPVLPPNATVMMMGTFPPTIDKWAMSFHYPNFYNDMWRIYGRVFFDDADYFRVGDDKRFDPERIRAFMFERGIASCPTVKQAIRETGNASDKNLTVVTPVNLDDILPQVPKVKTLFTTGGKATEVLLNLLSEPPAKSKYPKTNQSMDYPYEWQNTDNQKADVNNLTLYRLPSTSRAYPLSLDKKVAAYKSFFEKMDKL